MDYSRMYTRIKFKYNPSGYSFRDRLFVFDSVADWNNAVPRIPDFDSAENQLLEIVEEHSNDAGIPYRRCNAYDNKHTQRHNTIEDIADIADSIPGIVKQTHLYFGTSQFRFAGTSYANTALEAYTAMAYMLASEISAAQYFALADLDIGNYDVQTLRKTVTFEDMKKALVSDPAHIPFLEEDVAWCQYRYRFNSSNPIQQDEDYKSAYMHILTMYVLTRLEIRYLMQKLPNTQQNLLFDDMLSVRDSVEVIFDAVDVTTLPSDPVERFSRYLELLDSNKMVLKQQYNDSLLTEFPKKTNEFAALVQHASYISVQYIRYTQIAILYKFCKSKGWLDRDMSPSENVIDTASNSPLVTEISNETGDSSTNNSPIDLFNKQVSTAINTKASPYERKRVTRSEELERMCGDFTDGDYTFHVKPKYSLDETAKNQYMQIAEQRRCLCTNLSRRIKEIKVYNSGGKNPGQSTGKLDRKALWKHKTTSKIFYNNTYKVKECDPAFGIILDASGSMSGKGINDGKITLVILHEVLKDLRINHSIIAHNASRRHEPTIYRYYGFKEDPDYNVKKNYGIMNINAGGCNCDSGVLKYMEDRLMRTNNRDKICLIFSDGEPTECSDAELTDQIHAMERHGIKVIGIGIDFANIARFYTDNANGRSLKEMLNIVSDILKRYVLDKKE